MLNKGNNIYIYFHFHWVLLILYIYIIYIFGRLPLKIPGYIFIQGDFQQFYF